MEIIYIDKALTSMVDRAIGSFFPSWDSDLIHGHSQVERTQLIGSQKETNWAFAERPTSYEVPSRKQKKVPSPVPTNFRR